MSKNTKKFTVARAGSRWLIGASALALMSAFAVSAAQAQEGDALETVVVTGFRASLEKALDMKRQSLDASDSIMAEDIAKFPDMNVSESLQRIPGVNITRESGEGRQITVRGLGAQFTRVTINGMEALTTAGSQDVSTSGGGTNRSRSFDFNVFAADLFSNLTVHKSGSANIEEGSLGATVEMHTAHPFDHSGFVFSASGQLGYQEYAGSFNPRVAVLASNTFLGGRLGVLASATYGITNTLEEGTSSVRWQNDTNTSSSGASSSSYRFYSVNGATSGSDFTSANLAFRPRFPRYDIVSTHSKRLGLTGSVQWQPDDGTLFTLDAMFADFAQQRQEYYLEANAFSTSGTGSGGSFSNNGTTNYYRSIGVNNMKLINYDASDLAAETGVNSVGTKTYTLLRAEVNNVGLRNEHRLDHLDTRFMQVTLDGSHSFSEKLKVHALLGWSESHHRNPVQSTLMADYGCYQTTSCSSATGSNYGAQGYKYDYSYANIPLLSTGNVDPTSTSGWFLSNVRLRQEYVYNSFRSAAVDAEYKWMDELTFRAGAGARNFGYGTLEKRSSTTSSPYSENNNPTTASRSVDLSTYVSSIAFKAVKAPTGSNSEWFTIDFNKAAGALGLWDQSVYPVTSGPGYSNSGGVHENDYSGWAQAEWNVDVLNMPFKGDIGVRYVLTEMNSLGYTLSSSLLNTVEGHNVYHDFLPTLNMTLDPLEDVVVRFNAGYAMTRPGLGSMMPTGSVSISGSNAGASVGNPKLQPQRSKNLDLAFEWYYSKGSMLSVAGFWKHIDTFIQSVQTTGTWDKNPFGLTEEAFVAACGGSGTDWSSITTSYCKSSGGEDMSWTFTRSKNAKGAPLYGTEINWQQQLDFLPGKWSNLGFLANYTYVQAQQSYYNSDGSLIMRADLTNLSRNSYNATIYYDDKVLQGRVTAAYRGKYLFNNNIASNNNNYGIYSDSTLNIDASMSYKYSEELMFTFDAMNLTNQASNIYADKYAERSYQYHETGRVFYMGVKYTY